MPRFSWFLLTILLAGLLLSRESRRPGPVGGIDRAFFDWLGANAGVTAVSASAQVTLVEIDESILETPGRWPLSPLDYALFLQSLQKFDPAVVAIEPILRWPVAQRANEEILVNQALVVPKLLLAVQLGSAQGAADAAPVAPLEQVEGSTAALPEFPEIVAAPNARLFPLAVCGVTNLPAPGAPLREAPLLFRRRAQVLPSFALQALALWQQVALGEIRATPGGTVQLGGHPPVVIDRAGRALLNAAVFRQLNRIGLDDLLLLSDGPAAARLKGGLVILGRTDRASQTYTLPGGQRATPAEALAWATQSLRQQPALRRAGPAWDAGIVLAVAGLGLGLQRVSRRRALALAAGALAVYALGALSVFQLNGLSLPLALPAGLLATVGVCRLPREGQPI